MKYIISDFFGFQKVKKRYASDLAFALIFGLKQISKYFVIFPP